MSTKSSKKDIMKRQSFPHLIMYFQNLCFRSGPLCGPLASGPTKGGDRRAAWATVNGPRLSVTVSDLQFLPQTNTDQLRHETSWDSTIPALANCRHGGVLYQCGFQVRPKIHWSRPWIHQKSPRRVQGTVDANPRAKAWIAHRMTLTLDPFWVSIKNKQKYRLNRPVRPQAFFASAQREEQHV